MMKTLMNIKYLWLVCALLSAGLLASCDDDDDNKNSGQVELLSFGPSGVQHGENISFIGRNLDKVDTIELQGARILRASFVKQSSDLIVITVPEATEAGRVTLKTKDQVVVSKTDLSFEVPVTIASVPTIAKPGDTITITGEYMNWVEEVWFTEEVPVTVFVEKSLNALSFKVPMAAQTGPIVLITGGTEPLTIETEEEIEIILPTLVGLSPNPVERGDELTIIGTDLDLVEGVLFKGQTEPSTVFVSQSKTALVVVVPDEANQGNISLITYSQLHVVSSEPLKLVGALPPLAPLATAVYVDELAAGWAKWGWGGGSVDLANTDNVRDGEKSIKVVFDGSWGGSLQWGNGTISTTGRTKFVISIFGGAGSGGKDINMIVKGSSPNEKVITIVADEWTEYEIPLSDYGSPATVTEIIMQDRGWSGTIYVDHIGLR